MSAGGVPPVNNAGTLARGCFLGKQVPFFYRKLTFMGFLPYTSYRRRSKCASISSRVLPFVSGRKKAAVTK